MKRVFNKPVWYYIPVEGVEPTTLASLSDEELLQVLECSKQREDQKVYQVNPNFIMTQVADEWLVVPTGEMAQQFNGMMSLNASSRFVWEQFQTPNSICSVLQTLKERYEGNAADMEVELRQFVARCLAYQILQEVK
ncbi:MAG: PqqD family protein [Bacteroidaceae bacterium]|nr:PqqD family protein [Bacteroidaceae bacterium]